MDKTERIIDLVEHPDRYTETDIEQLLSDEDSRKLYQTIMETREAFILDDAKCKMQNAKLYSAEESSKFKVQSSKSKAAAIIVGLLVVSGIALAAVNIISQQQPKATQQTEQAVKPVAVAQKDTIKRKVAVKKPDVHETYTDVALSQILQDIAGYYGCTVSYNNEDVKQLRLYFEWDSRKPLEQVLRDLNQFESVNLTLKDNVITVE